VYLRSSILQSNSSLHTIFDNTPQIKVTILYLGRLFRTRLPNGMDLYQTRRCGRCSVDSLAPASTTSFLPGEPGRDTSALCSHETRTAVWTEFGSNAGKRLLGREKSSRSPMVLKWRIGGHSSRWFCRWCLPMPLYSVVGTTAGCSSASGEGSPWLNSSVASRSPPGKCSNYFY